MSEKMYGVYSSLDLITATKIADEALRLRAAHKFMPMAVAILDSGGNLVCFKRDDGCGILRFDIAFGKAWGALGMGLSSRQIGKNLTERIAFQGAVAAASNGRCIPVPGGVLIINKEDQVVGAVGISGDASEKDELCAIGGIKLVELIPIPKDAAIPS